MKGDFSRGTFDRQHGFSRVLMQQGRVLLDSDWNEQTSILLHYIRTLAADLIGQHGGPGDGFRVDCRDDDGNPLNCDFRIGRGHYYVDGILCENVAPEGCPGGDARPLTFRKQPDFPLKPDEKLKENTRYLVYLDVWERHLTHLQAEHIREVALGGPDTASRAKVVWQVKVADESKCGCDDDAGCAELLQKAVRSGPRCLRARARVDQPSDDPCIIPPEARYRGAENQLYRVEIHDAGDADTKRDATFKWSRDNGSVVFAIRSLKGSEVRLDSLGPDERRGLHEGDWVEIVDDRTALRGEPGVLARVDAIDRVRFSVLLSLPEGAVLPVFEESSATHPLLRRWDHGSDAIPVREGKWIDLEDGVQVWFEPGGDYRTGDYWRIPARTATGDIHWPVDVDDEGNRTPRAVRPDGIRHHYAPLGRISVDATGAVTCLGDCRCTFDRPCEGAVEPPPPPPVIREIMADQRATDNCETTPPVQFSADVSSTGPTNYAWDFGDGNTSQNPRPAHKFTTAGTHDIVLKVTNTGGTAESKLEFRVAQCERVAPPTPGGPNDPVVVVRERERERVIALMRIAGVGERRAELLVAAGRDTPESVSLMSNEEVRTVLGVGESIAEDIRANARLLSLER